jgi:hypothetical protein
MITADPMRTPTFTLFADPDWFFFATGGPVCPTPAACASIPPRGPSSFAWNHGDIQEDIAATWVGYVGPGVRNKGEMGDVWTDHVDVRPTMLNLVGLEDDYIHDGRVVVEPLYDWAIPPTLLAHYERVLRLGAVYKQLNAPFGTFSMDLLTASTRALASNDPGDATYTSIENQIESLTNQRNALASQIKMLLTDAAFNGQAINNQQAKNLIMQAEDLLNQAHTLATAP